MKILHRLVFVCLAAGCATGAAAGNAYPALYSFNDLYRLTVEGAGGEPLAASLPSTEPHQLRVATIQSVAAPAEVRFTVTPVPGPRPWMLLLAGLAAAAWVAHRRLTRPL
jgi:MYXO-CTERM domain-containing protein